MTSKYLGKVYEGFEVIEYYKQNPYKKQYAGDSKAVEHNAYNYVLYNKDRHQALTISGNALRHLNAGDTTIKEMFELRRGAYKNKQLASFKKKHKDLLW